ncbi:MAG: flagellar export protein FliJ [Rhodospirillaceae bacterium]
MPVRPTMDQLIELAEKKVDDAAQVLAARIARQRDAEAKLDMLVAYRTDYFNRFGTTAAYGIANHLLHNFRAFMEKLDAAITEQHSVVAEARLGVRTAQTLWQAEQQRLKSYRVLAQRRLGTERMREAKREQREQDEHASKAYVRSRASA